MLNKDFLDSIFASDTSGLIDKAPSITKSEPKVEYDIASQKEREVHDWIKEHGREPSEKSHDISEKMLAKRLKAMKKAKEPEIDNNPLNSPLLDDMLNKLNRNQSIYDFSNSLLTKSSDKPKNRNVNDFIAKRTAMKDFYQYEPMFLKVQREIDSKIRQIIPFTATTLNVGNFYIAGGLLCYIDKIYEEERTSFGRVDKRIHVIFANGTESNMLFATFQKIMSTEFGRIVTVPQDTNFEFGKEDVQTGIIYILRSASNNEVVTQFGKELYKVGYTSTTVEDRIKNAANEPTYLCAPVVIMEKWTCQNLNAKALETFLHKFFAKEQKHIKVFHKGKYQTATEWYHVPLEVLEKTVPLIICGDIVNYQYDSVNRDIVRVK